VLQNNNHAERIAGMSVEGQLTKTFTIPGYAQDMLYLVTDNGSAPTQGKYGKFSLNAPPTGSIRLTWGTASGPILVCWENVDELQLQWDGHINVGGFIERLHAHEVGGLELIIVEVIGGAFPVGHRGLASLEDMRAGIFARPADTEPIGSGQAYPFVVLAESNLAALAQDALVSGLGVDAYGSLASEASRWHEVVGLPLLLDTLTLLAP
jgi:hypothetical protein